MPELAYQESAIATSDTKLAAILMLFGFRVKQRPEICCEWSYEFASKEDYYRWRAGDKSVKFFETATWNLAGTIGKSRDHAARVCQMYADSVDGRASLKAILSELNPQLAADIQSIIDVLVLDMCKQVLDHREFLVRLLRAAPPEARWIIVRDPDDKHRLAKFGINATRHTVTECLNAL